MRAEAGGSRDAPMGHVLLQNAVLPLRACDVSTKSMREAGAPVRKAHWPSCSCTVIEHNALQPTLEVPWSARYQIPGTSRYDSRALAYLPSRYAHWCLAREIVTRDFIYHDLRALLTTNAWR